MNNFLEKHNQLVINELSARLPFGVQVYCKWYGYQEDRPTEDSGVVTDVNAIEGKVLVRRKTQVTEFPVNKYGCVVKPYLRSLSKMTADEEKEYDILFPYDTVLSPYNIGKIVEWYYRHHIDFRGLIEFGVALEAPDGLYDTTGGDEVVRRRESSSQAVVDSYTNTFNRKYKNLPSIKGDELHRFKNFLNTVQQTFGLKFAAFKKQEELFCNLAKLWAIWGAENLDSISKGDGDVPSKKKFTRSEKKHRNPDRIYPEGTKVVKFSGKPFKSGEHVNTVKDVIEHPNKIDKNTGQGVPAYTFYEDDSIVECASCTWAESIPVQL